ncbi:MAG: YlzJ-like family protein [bacterium]|nr:YlzJ-like family protein [bacterium]
MVLEGLDGVGRHRRELETAPGVVVLDVDEWGRAVVNRLIATDPQAYLNPRWAPGTPLEP